MKQFKSNISQSGLLLFLTLVTTVAVYFSGGIVDFLGANVFGIPQHAPFDGTVFPVKKVPNWVKLPAEIKNAQYSSIDPKDLIDIPKYDASVLAKDVALLKWGDPADDLQRNAKITYPVPYLGNYKLDGKEFAGSHPAVDIKIPFSTPIFAIANGTVIKTASQPGGFGYHLVIQHNNFPSLEDVNKKTKLYSSYSHLGSILVENGAVVTKGQQIGLSGKTGTATVPHLHFQLDNDVAPWHPFWPFTWTEASDAGLDFFSAINAGLGLESAIKTTINPMTYIQKYFNDTSVSTSPNSSTNTGIADAVVTANSASSSSYIPTNVALDSINADEYVPENVNEVPITPVEATAIPTVPTAPTVPTVPTPVVVTPEVKKPLEADGTFTFSFDVKPEFSLSGGNDVTILVKNSLGLPYNNGFVSEIKLTSLKGNFNVKDSIVSSVQFDKNGTFRTTLQNLKVGEDRLKLDYDGQLYFSDWFKVVENLNVNFSDVPTSSKYSEAITYLVKHGVVSGYPDNTFRPSKTVSRVEALKFIFEGIKQSVASGKLPFTDVSESEWYAKYLYTAYKNSVVDGYEDGTFRPTNTVNTAEFYKLLFAGMRVEVDSTVLEKPFDDVEIDQWFSPYLAYAKKLGIIDSNVKIANPSNGMSRGEVAYAIFKLMQTMK